MMRDGVPWFGVVGVEAIARLWENNREQRGGDQGLPVRLSQSFTIAHNLL